MKKIVIGCIALAGLGAVGVVVLLSYHSRDLPSIDSLVNYRPKLVTTIYSKENKVIASYAQERRVFLPPTEMPENVVDAFVAAEDDQFFNHIGVNPITILRAAIKNIQAGRKVQGGSTITQQVAKTFLLSSEKSYTRKIKEAILAFQIERALSKDEILNLYLNQIFLGQNSYGVEAAALTYYGKSSQDLTIAEAAVLAGLPRAPSRDNPVANPKIAKVRQHYVLGRMLETRRISKEEYDAAMVEDLKIISNPPGISSPTPYLAEHVRRSVLKKYGEDRLAAGLSVYTSVPYDNQIAAQEAVNKGLRAVDKRLGLRRPKKQITTRSERSEFSQKQHEELVKEFYNFRILDPEGEMRDPVDLANPTPIELGKNYEGLVIGKDRKSKSIKVRLGNRTGMIGPDDYKWAMEANPEEVYGEKIIRDPYREYSLGDVITVEAHAFVEEEEEPEAEKPIEEQILDANAESQIEEIKNQEIVFKLEQQPLVQGALISYSIADGSLQAMVGGYDFEITKSHFNRAIQALRQPGSTFKPFVYGAALETGLTPSTIIVDSPIVYSSQDEQSEVEKHWKPNNYGQRFYGDTTLRNAMAFSRNIPTIKLAQHLKINTIIDFARKLGVTSPLAPDLSVALGSSAVSINEVVKAWSVFANKGKELDHYYLERVLDWEGNEMVIAELGEGATNGAITEVDSASTVAETQDETDIPSAADLLSKNEELPNQAMFGSQDLPEGQIIDERVAYLITSILRSVINYGTAQTVKALDRPAAGKTGTTNDFKDAWFIGYTPQMITGVWVGFDGDRPIGRNETGSRAAAPIWIEYMKAALKDMEPEPFEIPEGIIQVKVDSKTGDIPTQSTDKVVTEFFIDGNAPGQMARSEETEDPLEQLINQEPRMLKTQVITGNPSMGSPMTQPLNQGESDSGFDELLREDL